jgi:hypothetical protein
VISHYHWGLNDDRQERSTRRLDVLGGTVPHRPLKVGIAADLVARRAELDRRKLRAVLTPTPSASCIGRPWSRARPASISTAIRPAK